MPSLANRLLQVGLLSSIASSPLSSATSAFAVSISFCAFILRCLISSCGLGTDRSSRLEPAQRVPVLRFRKVFDLHMHKMGGDLGQFPQKFAVGDHRQSDNLLVMAFDELHMSEKRFEIRPAGKCFGVNHQAR